MFDLEKSIVNWREEMRAAGIGAAVLDELEGHLREEIEQQLQTGLNLPAAFGIATRQMGQTAALKAEFSKAGTTIFEQLKQLAGTLAGTHRYQLAANMNTIATKLEPRWATYLKTAAFIMPAACLWVLSCVFILPKLQQLCVVAKVTMPGPIATAIALSDLLRQNLIATSAMVLLTLILLEWRAHWWPNYRRFVFGTVMFVLNSGTLLLITALLIMAVMVAAHLSGEK